MNNATQPLDHPAPPKLPVAIYLSHESKNGHNDHAPFQEFNSKPCPEAVASSASDKDSIIGHKKHKLRTVARFPFTETASQDFEHIGSWIIEEQPRDNHTQPSKLLSRSGTVQSKNYSMRQYLEHKRQDEPWNRTDDSDTERDKSKGAVNREPEVGDILTTSSEDMKNNGENIEEEKHSKDDADEE